MLEVCCIFFEPQIHFEKTVSKFVGHQILSSPPTHSHSVSPPSGLSITCSPLHSLSTSSFIYCALLQLVRALDPSLLFSSLPSTSSLDKDAFIYINTVYST